MASRGNLRISVAIAASLGVHFAAATAMTPAGPKIEIEGGATAEIAALGSSFEDLLAGTSAAQPAEVTPSKTAKPVAEPLAMPSPDVETPAHPGKSAKSLPEKQTATKPVDVPRASKPVEIAHADVAQTPSQRPAETPTRPAEVPPSKVVEASAESPQAIPQSISPLLTTASAAPSPTGATATEAQMPQAATTLPAPARRQAEATQVEPVETAALTPAHAAETIEAEPEENPIPVPIARPPQPQDERNRAEARERQTAKKKEPVKTQQVANVARGNADRNARAGDATGRETSRAKTGGAQSGGKASNAGNASASNYPGKVYAKIRRTRQKRAGGQGVAQIRFSISSSGGLASIRLASSSGSGAVDSAALDHIRRSAPFPPPPAGAQRQFVIPVEVRR